MKEYKDVKRIHEIMKEMTLEEKLCFLTGAGGMETYAIERLGIPSFKMADGPHGIRAEEDKNCTSFPNLCCVGSSWDVELTHKLGEALAEECVERDISMLLGPGINIKRHILCGRNFEYFSEDPVLAGELGAAYINGLQSKGVGASLKHYACNNQEEHRTEISVDVDIRTLREIYLKGFEIAVKKANPASVMCAYNRVNSIWCSENKHLLTDILKKEWQYDGVVVSDWGAVHDVAKAVSAGLDLEMPRNDNIVEKLKQALGEGKISMEDIDHAVFRLLQLVTKPVPKPVLYDRKRQHEIAREVAAAGMVLLKNSRKTLPLTAEKYQKVSVIGEFAKKPLICGQGSAEVNVQSQYVDEPLEELRKIFCDKVEIQYRDFFKKGEYSDTMLWPRTQEYQEFIKDSDAVIVFIGSMTSEDTEYFDRRTASFNPNYEMFINLACDAGKKVVVVMQTGGAMLLGAWHKRVDAIVQMWLAGEGGGKAIADVLTGRINPSGRLSETFPNVMRSDLEYPGDGVVVEYKEKLDVGYRYYDKHPEEICYPFGHGLSYSKFKYEELEVSVQEDYLCVQVTVSNISDVNGSEVVQLYVGSSSGIRHPIKELKAFQKIMVPAGQKEIVKFTLDLKELAYYNVMQNCWVVESGDYEVYVGASSQDIRCNKQVWLKGNETYTLKRVGQDMIG